MKLMRKLEKQALARAAKEARKQQGKRAQGCKNAGEGYSAGQPVISVYFDLNEPSIKTSRPFGKKHMLLIYPLFLYVG